MSGFYHLSVNVISRSTGRSAVACAAYRAGALLRDERYGTTHDYERRRGIHDTGIVAPPDAPAWARSRERLWNAVEAAEKRKDSQLAREFVLAFPHELNREQRLETLAEFITTQFRERGFVADFAIHAPNRKGDERNWHAHVLVSMRGINADGFDAMKDRSLNNPEQLVRWREAWADVQNRAFERYALRDEDGCIASVDHRSYKARGIEREPTTHVGVHATAMERSGRSTERGEINRQIEQQNERREVLRRAAFVLRREEVELIMNLSREKNSRPDPYRPSHEYSRGDEWDRGYGHERDP